jgi:cbb3-type cytochrome oxidase subunit 3
VTGHVMPSCNDFGAVTCVYMGPYSFVIQMTILLLLLACVIWALRSVKSHRHHRHENSWRYPSDDDGEDRGEDRGDRP